MATTSLPALQTAIKNTLNTIFPTNEAPELDVKITQLSQQLAVDIDSYVQDVVSKITGTGVVAPSIPVQVAVPAGTGATTAPGTVSSVTLVTN